MPALTAAVADWVTVARGTKRAEYVFKPLVMILLVAAAVSMRAAGAPDRQVIFTIAALVLSLAGDVFLMLERDLFVQGLAAFLLAHVCYFIAFGPWAPDFAIDYLVIAVLVAVGGTLYLRFLEGMRAAGKEELAVPVALYVVAITAMVYAAWSLGDQAGADASGGALVAGKENGWPLSARNSATIGAVLFMSSDALIGWTRFVGALRWAPLAIIVTYHLGQTLLVLALLP